MRVPPHVHRACIHPVRCLLPLLAGLFWLGACATPPASDTQTAMRQRIVSAAERLIGTRYVLGGESPDGVDCSGLAQYAYLQAGIRIPRTTAAQLQAGRSQRRVLPGDLLFFHGGDGTVSHVGIYAGKGQMIHASSGAGKVLKTNLSQRYWQRHLMRGATFLRETNAPVAGSPLRHDGFSG